MHLARSATTRLGNSRGTFGKAIAHIFSFEDARLEDKDNTISWLWPAYQAAAKSDGLSGRDRMERYAIRNAA